MRLRNIPEAKEIVAQSPYVIKNPAERKGMWKTFSRGPLYVEIGTGKGRFLMELAARHPENEYIGVEMYESVLMRACQKMEGRVAMDPASRSIEAMEREKASPDLQDGEGRIQLFVKVDEVGEEALAAFKKLDIGDIITVIHPSFKLQARVERFTQKAQNNNTETTVEVGQITIVR